jgi:small nuclear ribonucleoprotein (snRNP)-like protein
MNIEHKCIMYKQENEIMRGTMNIRIDNIRVIKIVSHTDQI